MVPAIWSGAMPISVSDAPGRSRAPTTVIPWTSCTVCAISAAPTSSTPTSLPLQKLAASETDPSGTMVWTIRSGSDGSSENCQKASTKGASGGSGGNSS
jgi:hypothetical protein